MNRPLRIQIVRQTGLAGTHHIVTLANFLADSGHAVRVACVEPKTEAIEGLSDKVVVSELGVDPGRGVGKLRARWLGGRRLRAHLQTQVFDVLYVIDSWTLPTLWFATYGRLRWPGVSTVYHTFDWLEPGLAPGVYRGLEKQICRAADLVVNTDRARARLQRTLYGLRATPLWVQNCLSRNMAIPAPNEELRSQMAGCVDSTGLRILIYPTVVSNEASAQRMTWELIQAVRRLPEHVRLVLFHREGPEYRRCLAACSGSDIDGRVKFLQPMPFLRLLEYVASADAGAIFYDDSQSSGYFMCNADKLSLLAACGIPIVGSDQPNLESVIYRHRLGECCDPRNSELLAAAILRTLDGSPSLAERKRLARQAFLQDLCFEAHGPRLLSGLEELHAKP